MYPRNYRYHQGSYVNNYGYGERQFIVPFLLGGLAGGAAVGLTRPRPIYNVAPQGPAYYPGPVYYSGMPYYYNSYGYYRPY